MKILNAAVCFKLERSGIKLAQLKLANSRDINVRAILTDNNINGRYTSSITEHLSGSEE